MTGPCTAGFVFLGEGKKAVKSQDSFFYFYFLQLVIKVKH